MARHQVEYANVVVRAEKRELLDLFEELVWPALADRQLRRSYGDSTFFISDRRGLVVEWKGSRQALVVARLVKTTTLRREQYYDPRKGLVPDNQALESAPSGVLVLILNSHKLVYFHETAHAPPLGQVGSVLERFIHTKHEQAIRARLAQRTAEGVAVTLRGLREEFPRPNVDVIPLSSDSTLSEFLDTFDILKTVEVRLVRPNAELDLNPFFQTARAEQERLNSAQTTITQKNKEGLSAKEAKPYVAAATKQGNAHVKLAGLDESGDKIVGDNASFSIKTELKKLPKRLLSAGRALFDEFAKLAESGRIPLTAQTPDSNRKSARIAADLGWGDGNSGKGGTDGPGE